MTPHVSRSQPAARTAKPDDWSAERTQLALQAAEIGTYDWDLVRGTLDWSERCKAIFGLAADDAVDYDVFLSRVHPDDHAPLAAAVAAALDADGTGGYRIEYRALQPDGTVRWIDARGQAYFADRDGRRQGVRLIGTMLDVTDAKRTRDSEARTHLALSAARLSYWSWNLLTGEVILGPGSKELLGIPDHHVVENYEAFEHLVHPEDRPVIRDRVAQALADEAPYEAEFRFASAGEPMRWILGKGDFVRDREGKVVGLTGVNIDITERRQAEAALRSSETRTRKLIEASPIGLVIGDAEGRLHYGNPAIQAMLGYTAEAFESGAVRWDALTPPEYASLDDEAIRQMRETGVCTPYEKVYIARDGRRVPVYVGAAALSRSGDALAEIAAFVADLTAQKEAEAQARKTDELLRAITDAAPAPIFVKDAECRTVFANPATFRVMGKSPGEVLGHTVADYFADPDEIAAVLASDRRVLATGETAVAEFTATDAEGTRRVFQSTRAPLRDGSGAVTGFVGISIDITERKRLEERQALMVRELHHRVKNTLATVQAIINSTARTAATIEAFRQAVEDRVTALARTHTLLTGSAWSGASLRDVLSGELKPYDDGGRVRLDGPHVRLPAEILPSFGMAVHELTTNAAKHGALSRPGGRVEVSWSVTGEAEASRLILSWVEKGGPPVPRPARQGFGSMLLDRVLGHQLQGQVETVYAPDGVRVRIDAPLPASG